MSEKTACILRHLSLSLYATKNHISWNIPIPDLSNGFYRNVHRMHTTNLAPATFPFLPHHFVSTHAVQVQIVNS